MDAGGAPVALHQHAPPVVTGLPGSALQMRQTDITVTPVTTETLKTLKDVDTGQPVVASYLRGRDGALTESVGADAAGGGGEPQRAG